MPYGKYVTDRKTISIDSAKQRKRGRDRLQHGGDNFRFVRWGGLGDLSLWPAIIQVEIPRIDQGVFDTLHSTMKKAEDETGKYDAKAVWRKR
jgi:hypothetical protein